MESGLEIEFKNMLYKEDFKLLMEKLQLHEEDFFRQINHYFDTKEYAFKQQGAALRIRELDHEFELTLKKKKPVGVLELNQSIDLNEVNQLLKQQAFPTGGIKKEVIAMGISPNELLFYGSLVTDRAEVPFKDGCLMLDRSIYFDLEDYEVEYEVNETAIEKGKQQFKQLLNELNIPIEKADSKIKRFFDARERL